MKIDKLKIGSYYKVLLHSKNNFYYFRFEKALNGLIYSYGYAISSIRNNMMYYTNKHFSDEQFIIFYKVEEILIEDIIEYLPDDNKEKISYLRKNKIKTLLDE